MGNNNKKRMKVRCMHPICMKLFDSKSSLSKHLVAKGHLMPKPLKSSQWLAAKAA
jgi:hypothetical protein